MVTEQNSATAFTVTPAALGQIKTMRDSSPRNLGKSLRIFIEGSCCSKEYGLVFDDPQAGDIEQRVDGVQVIMDPESRDMLEGSVLDYVAAGPEVGFTLVNLRKPENCRGC